MTDNRYDDIIHLPHHVSQNHPQMPLRDRAAQFAPFAALTGCEAAVGETARLTAKRRELSSPEFTARPSQQVFSPVRRLDARNRHSACASYPQTSW